MQEIFDNLTCINLTPLYSEHMSWCHRGSFQTGFTVHYKNGYKITSKKQDKCKKKQQKWMI